MDLKIYLFSLITDGVAEVATYVSIFTKTLFLLTISLFRCKDQPEKC